MKPSEQITKIAGRYLDGALNEIALDVAKLEAENESLNKRYNGLLLSVESVHSGETRHETALRYIQEAEQGSDNAAKGEDDETRRCCKTDSFRTL